MASFISLLALGAAVVNAQTGSITTKPTLPFNSQIGAFRFPIACDIYSVLPITLDGYYTATAPIYATRNEKVEYADVTALITVPRYITDLGSAVGVAYANVQVFVNVLNDNAAPATYPVFPKGLWVNHTKLAFGQDLKVRVPVAGTLKPLGPFTLGSSPGVNNIFIGAIRANVHLYNASGHELLSAPITCPELKNPVVLGSVNIEAGPVNSSLLAPSQTNPTNFPALLDNQEVGYYHIQYNCDIGPLQNIPVDLVFGGQLFSGYAANSQFSLTNIISFLTIPQNFITAAEAAYNAATFKTTVNTVNIGLTNASPSSANIISSPITLKSAAPKSGGLKITLPASGVLTAGPFKAGSKAGDYMVLSLGTAAGTVDIQDSTGATTFSAPLSCGPLFPTTLYGILINPAKK